MTTAADTFRSLHHGERVLVLPNAWDAASARLIEECGAAAIATTSAAVAWTHGRSDGEQLEPAALLATVRAIVRVVHVPVSVDAESGYSDDPEGIAGVIAAILDAGAVGVNLEDGLAPPERLASKIGVAKRAAASAGHALFVNARADVYLRGLATGEAAVTETLRRARMYREAGADGLFVPGVVEPDAIRTLAQEAGLPLNVLARPNLGSVEELRALGVRRLSVGGSLALAALGLARRATRELLDHGTYAALFADSAKGAELNAWFAR